ncbi:hypothetical protein BpHYR1_041008 [Brachionus plicatilis]|uniref:Uncharacterized protein n=1 Tax=Brachionus plicatilis TaxID=10195 RepID=A0A3M7QX40_BRAPC|nr:hypothetical protein BpHYR1_041008 [Brachionus plicatilis]
MYAQVAIFCLFNVGIWRNSVVSLVFNLVSEQERKKNEKPASYLWVLKKINLKPLEFSINHVQRNRVKCISRVFGYLDL